MARSTVRTIYTLGFLTVGLLTSTSLCSPAQADVSTAKTGWAMNKVASAASGSYCTMAQKYSDETIVTFAKSKGGEYSVAFDFVKPQFPNSTATTVSLRPGNGSAQTFSVAPQSDKVIVIGLGTNDSFLKAVGQTAKIDIESGGKVHSFAPSKFAAAADELSGCTGTMKPNVASAKATTSKTEPAKQIASIPPQTIVASMEPAAGLATYAPPTIVSNPDAAQVSQIAPDKSEMAQIQAENTQLKQALVEERRNFESQLKNSQSAMNSELNEKIASVQKENETLKAQKSVSPELTAELAKIKSDLAAAQTQNQTLQAQASQAVQAQQASIATTQQIAQLQKQNGDMKAQLDAANQTVGQLQTKTAQSEAATQQIAQLQKQNAETKAQLDAAMLASSQLQAKSEEAANTVAQLSTLQKQNADVKAQLDAANQTVGQLQAKTIQSASAAEQVAALQKQTADMKAQMDSANKTIADLQAKNTQTSTVTSQVAVLQKQNTDMQAQLAAANQTAAQLQAKVTQSTVASDQVAALQKQLDTSNQTVAQLQTKVAQSAGASDQVAALQKQLDTSNQTVEQLQAKAAQAPVIDPNAVAQVQAAEKENAALKQQIAALQSAPATPAIDQQQVASLQSENAALKSQIIDLKNRPVMTSANTASNPAIKNLQAQLNAAAQENGALKAQIAALPTSSGPAQASAQSSNWDLEQATKRYQESQREIQRLASKIQQQEKDFDQQKKDLQNKLFDPAVADQAQRDRLNQLEQKVADLQAGKPMSNSETQTAALAPVSPAAVPVPAVIKAPEPVANIAPAAGTPIKGLGNVDDLPMPAFTMPMAVSSKPAKPITMPVASAVVSPAAKVEFQSREDFEKMLKNAGINIQGPVEEVAGGNADSYRAYRWKTSSLYGSVQQQAMKSEKSFDPAVDEYLARAKTRCSGDFAAVPSDVSITAEKVKSFEIACIGGKESTSASVLFIYGNDVMTTLAHEGKSEAMDLAMEARDRVANQVTSVKTASK